MNNIDNIQSVKRNRREKKGALPKDGEDLMYLVNFSNKQGYAILAADNRIGEPVLALTDNGSISAHQFDELQERLVGMKLGLKSDLSYIINVDGENLDLYCPEDDDYYMGGDSDIEKQQMYLLDMIDSYARNSVESNTSGSKYHRGNGPVIEEKVLLTSKWHQNSPFNDLTPIKKGKHSPAGCVAIAVGQIMAYHEYPANLTCNGVYCDWSIMRKYYHTSDPGSNELANFMSVVGIGCNRVVQNTLLVHCNFGWNGFSNGYYASGIFDIKRGPIELSEGDFNINSGITNKYNWWFRVLTYDKPNN